MLKFIYKYTLIAGLFLFIFIIVIIYTLNLNIKNNNAQGDTKKPPNSYVIDESDNPKDSKDDIFWLNSGANFYVNGDTYHTIIGDLPAFSRWRTLYAITNPTDTDDGYHPQNIFRLVTKEKLKDMSEQAHMLIVKYNLSKSSNRNETNGIYLMGRYINSNNLYYAGVRVDGNAIIKKKIGGIYYTLAQTPLFIGNYDRNKNPNLLPANTWIGLKVKITNINRSTTGIELYIDKDNIDKWEKVISYIDTLEKNKGAIITSSGYGGIRSDFMDIEIKNYSFSPLQD